MDIEEIKRDYLQAEKRHDKAIMAYHTERNHDKRAAVVKEKNEARAEWLRLKKIIEAAETKVSNCCGAVIPINGLDYDICPECKEHCEFVNDGE